MFPIHEFSDVDVTFPTKIKKFMPVMEDIPAEFKEWGGTKWNKLFSDWFFDGVESLELTPKDGVDPKKAVRHIRYLMGSWELSHEHKEAGVSFLLSEWFSDVKYMKKEKK